MQFLLLAALAFSTPSEAGQVCDQAAIDVKKTAKIVVDAWKAEGFVIDKSRPVTVTSRYVTQDADGKTKQQCMGKVTL